MPGVDLDVNCLREFSDSPLLCGPLVCQLCTAEFLYNPDFALHQTKEHAGNSKYRKRAPYLLQQRGCRPVTAQKKRLMVRNFAAFQQFPA